jgi:hypothetical protein
MEDSINKKTNSGLNHRKLLKSGLALAAMLSSACKVPMMSATAGASSNRYGSQVKGRHKPGTPEVSSVGPGVHYMSRKYATEVPSRPEMQNIIRTAFDHDSIFYDAAGAYGLIEVEHGIAPFRDKVVIASKFGWNIDLNTGQRLPKAVLQCPGVVVPSKK